MPNDRNDGRDREKLSWRERDAMKNKSRHVHEDKPSFENSSVQKRSETLAKKALEDLFQPKKNKEQSDEWKKVSSATGREFEKKSKVYVEKHGMPKVWDDLMRLMDNEDPDFLSEVLDQVERTAEHENKSRLEVAVAKISILKITHEHPGVLKKLNALGEALSLKTEG